MEHRNITGLDAVHPFTIRQAADPGAIGADKGWLDTSANPPKLRIRNAANDGWELPGAAGGGPPTAYANAAARDAAVPAPTGNEVASLVAEGWQTRYDAGRGRWLKEGVTGTAGPLVRLGAKNGFGDGAHNERQAFVDVDAELLGSGVGIGELDPGTWRVDASVTLYGHYHANRGFTIKPNLGVVVTFAGILDAGVYPIIDYSLGGTVVFTGQQTEYEAAWFNMPTDGTGNASINLAKAVAAVPDNTTLRVRYGQRFNLGTNWTVPDRVNVQIRSGLDARISAGAPPTFFWTGAAGGTMITMDRCRNCIWQGCRFESGAADCIIDDDNYSVGHIGTQNTYEENSFNETQPRATHVSLRISNTVLSNHEYLHIRRNAFNGYEGGIGVLSTTGGSIGAGSTAYADTGGYFNPGHVGARIRIAKAGAGGGVHDTTIAAFVDANHVTLAAPAVTAVAANGYALIGQTYGVAIQLGGAVSSANVKGIVIEHNNINTYEKGIYQRNGSIRPAYNSFNSCAQAFYVETGTEPILDVQTNTEYCLQYVVSGVVFRSLGARIGLQRPMPGGALCQGASSLARISMIDTFFDDKLPVGSGATITNADAAYRNNNWPNLFTLENLQFPVGLFPSLADLGGTIYTPWTLRRVFPSDFIAVMESYVNLIGERTHITQEEVTALKVTMTHRDVGAPDGEAALVGEYDAATGSGGVWTSVRAQVKQTANLTNKTIRLFESKLDCNQPNGHPLLEHFTATSPSYGPGGVTDSVAFRAKKQKVAGVVGVGYAFMQDDPADITLFKGQMYQGLPNVAPDDTKIPAGGIAWYVDEAGNQLKARVKYADGVTMKDLTPIALV